MPFGTLLTGSFKFGYFQYPLQQVRKTDAVDLSFRKIITETLIEFHGYIFVVIPVYGWFNMRHVRIGSLEFGVWGLGFGVVFFIRLRIGFGRGG